jgi:hypothetical protein
MIIKSKRNSRKIKSMEKKLAGKIQQTFNIMRKEFLGVSKMVLKEAEITDPVDLLIQLGFAKIAEDIAEYQIGAFVYSYLDTAKRLSVAYDLERVNQRAISAVQDRKKITEAMKEYTKTKLLESLGEALEGGMTYNEYLKNSEKIFALKPYRARRIAINEIGSVYTEATRQAVKEGVKQTGSKVFKQWVTVGDDDVTDQCEANQDLGWVPLDYIYNPEGITEPPRFIGCRCTETYDIQDGFSDEEVNTN